MQVLRADSSLPSQVQTVTLGDVSCRLRLDWRERTGAWYASLWTEAGDVIVQGVRLEPGADLLHLADPGLAPDGRLLVVAAGGAGDGGTRSWVMLTLGGTAFTVPVGAVAEDTAGQTWRIRNEATKAVGDPSPVVAAEATSPGPIDAAAGIITVIVTPITGWATVTNAAAAVPGLYPAEMLREDLGLGVRLVFVPTSELPSEVAVAWAASTAYGYGALVRPSPRNGLLYTCIRAGTSGQTAPSWPTAYDDPVDDGGAQWERSETVDDDEPTIVLV